MISFILMTTPQLPLSFVRYLSTSQAENKTPKDFLIKSTFISVSDSLPVFPSDLPGCLYYKLWDLTVRDKLEFNEFYLRMTRREMPTDIESFVWICSICLAQLTKWKMWVGS